MKNGRPTIYTEELAAKICELVATNPIGLPKLCKIYNELPTAETIRVWRWEKTIFSANYAEAKRFQAELMAESLEDVIDETSEYVYEDENGVTRVDGGMVAKARLVIDTRKWTASKLAPKIYGDQKQVEELQSQNQSIKRELDDLRIKLAKQNEREY